QLLRRIGPQNAQLVDQQYPWNTGDPRGFLQRSFTFSATKIWGQVMPFALQAVRTVSTSRSRLTPTISNAAWSRAVAKRPRSSASVALPLPCRPATRCRCWITLRSASLAMSLVLRGGAASSTSIQGGIRVMFHFLLCGLCALCAQPLLMVARRGHGGRRGRNG